ncbi:MAG: trigger factor [Candidatus Buchananbacteria bacterium CG10_big_fil_rev_8_21_14_0_10_42_9]|uniref:Trigger factor n=1 Tax=Candidatus Buchananbacteria bacterium CG10_big_fil_rev_8_21_14_0_10_42_9 TaxID=1974526 RepID=A0A2H0W128_9BACT|nr:MAG: trigger factor [Candidatus Buchananbacteria bacterium CG10_big_fil_rev_8_21_14_0_10_42_9]
MPQIKQEPQPRGQLKITVEISPEEMQPFLKRAAEDVSKTQDIAGFRPGKAPMDVVIKKVGEMPLWQAAADLAVQKSLLKTFEDEKIRTIGSPQVKIDKLAPENSLIYTATVNIFPEVTLGDLDKVAIEAKPAEVSDKDFDTALENLRKLRASEIAVTTEAKAGDKVEIDLEVFQDRVPIEHGAQKKLPLILGDSHFVPGFEEKVIGMKVGDTKEFKLTMPESYHLKQIAGKEVEYRIKMLAIFQRSLPEINDEFAKSLGMKSADELKKNIKDNLKAEAESKEKVRQEEAIMKALINASKFSELPDLLVSSETNQMIQELEANVTRQGGKFEDYLNHIKKSREELTLELAPRAIERVKSALILREVAQQQNISVDDTEIEAEIEKARAMSQGNPDMAKQLDTPEYRDYVSNILASRKVIEWLRQKLVK